MSKMWKTMLKNNWFSYVRRPCPSLNITKPLCSPALDILKTMTMPRRKKDWYLYMIVSDWGSKSEIWRLNIDEFCRKRSSLFELVHDFGPFDESCFGACVQTCITLGPNLYMVNSQNKIEGYFFDPANPDGQCIRRLEHAAIPRLVDPRLFMYGENVIVCTIENKIYVLAKYAHEIEDNHEQPPLFKVYDPLSRTWKHLPYPPFFNKLEQSYTKYSGREHFVWGHRLGVRHSHDDETHESYIFDTHHQKWAYYRRKDHLKRRDSTEDDGTTTSDEILSKGFAAVVEFEGYLIGIPAYRRSQLVAYQLDSNGNPKLYRVLHELQGIFCPFLNTSSSKCYLGEFNGGRIWFVQTNGIIGTYNIYGSDYTRIAVFQVSISKDLAGTPILSAHIEAAEFYEDLNISTAFVMRHHLNKHDTKKEVLCGNIVPHTC